MSVDRADLITQALELGIDKQILDRSPLYAIELMIKEAIEDTKASQKRSSSVPPPPSSPQKLDVREEEDVDDDQTVVDMSHIVNHDNPADQKYNRFRFLVRAKNDFTDAIKNNTRILQKQHDKLDPDDILVIETEIKSMQSDLDLVNKEMREINQWFHEVHAARQAYYQELQSNLSDISGNVKDHFQRKCENLNAYIANMNTTMV